MSRKVYPITLPRAGISVLLAELKPSELVNAMKMAGNDDAATVRGRKVSREALRFSIREVNGDPVSYGDLEGDGWRKYFPRTRHAAQLTDAWARVHLPGRDELEAVEASMNVQIDGDTERWTVKLPGGRVVLLAEQEESSVDDALRAAEGATKSEAAQSFLTAIESARRSLREVDGRTVTRDDLSNRRWDELFSVRETYLLGHAFGVIHGGGEEIVVGEARPASGTA